MRGIAIRTLIGLLALAWTAPAVAHGDGEPGHKHYTVLVFEKVDPAGLPHYEAATKTWVDQFGSGKSELNWFTATNANFTYAYLMNIDSYAELDSMEEQFTSALDGLEADRVAALMAGEQHVTSRWRELLMERPDLSYPGKAMDPATAAPPGVIHVTVVSIKPAMRARFEKLLTTVRDAYAKAEHPHGYQVSQIEFGEGSYAFVNDAADRAELYGRPEAPEVLAGALGAEKAQALLGEWLACVSTVVTEDWTPRMDLSVLPTPAAAASE